jgi:hypothetical protein
VIDHPLPPFKKRYSTFWKGTSKKKNIPTTTAEGGRAILQNSAFDVRCSSYLRTKLDPGFRGTLGKIDLLFAALAGMFLFKLVRKDLGFSTAGGTLADKRLKMFHLLESWTM